MQILYMSWQAKRTERIRNKWKSEGKHDKVKSEIKKRKEMERRGEGVYSPCCNANECGAAAMLTNSSSHCWTHHLLMLPTPFRSLYPFIFPLLSPGFSFLNTRSFAVARVCALTWQQLGRGRCGGMWCTVQECFCLLLVYSLHQRQKWNQPFKWRRWIRWEGRKCWMDA